MATSEKSSKNSQSEAQGGQQTNAGTQSEVSGAWTVVEETVVEVEAEPKGTNVINIQNVDAEEKVSTSGKMLYRDQSDKVISGVCAGLANSLGWDPTLVRVLWVGTTLVTFLWGGVLAYLAFSLLLPSKNAKTGEVTPATISINQQNSSVLAYVLMGVGVFILLSRIGVLGGLFGGLWSIINIAFWPAIMIGIGYMLLGRSNKLEWKNSMKGARSSMQDRFNKSGVKMNFTNKMDTETMRNSFGRARSNLPLRRSTSDRMMMGVCGGLSTKLGIDANLIRFGWVILTFFSGFLPGVGIYLALGLLLPEEGVVYTQQSSKERKKRQTVQDVQIL